MTGRILARAGRVRLVGVVRALRGAMTDADDTSITAASAADRDARPLDAERLARMRPASPAAARIAEKSKAGRAPARSSGASGPHSSTGGLRQKSRSTTNCPILACKRAISASLAAGAASAFVPKLAAMPSIACRFQAAIIVWCTPCLALNSASVCSPLIASNATRALKSAEYRLRVTFPIRSRPTKRRD